MANAIKNFHFDFLHPSLTCQYNKEPCLKEGIPIIVLIVQLIEASTCVWGVFIMELANSDLPTQMYK